MRFAGEGEGEGDRNIGEIKRFTGDTGCAGGAGDAGEWAVLVTISSIIYTGRPSGVEEPAC